MEPQCRSWITPDIIGTKDELTALPKTIDRSTGGFFSEFMIRSKYTDYFHRHDFHAREPSMTVRHMLQRFPRTGKPLTWMQKITVLGILLSDGVTDDVKRTRLFTAFPDALSVFHFWDPLTGREYSIEETCLSICEYGTGILFRELPYIDYWSNHFGRPPITSTQHLAKLLKATYL